jgi:hypothetical protein
LFFPKDLAASIFRYLCAFGLAAAEAIPNGWHHQAGGPTHFLILF